LRLLLASMPKKGTSYSNSIESQISLSNQENLFEFFA